MKTKISVQKKNVLCNIHVSVYTIQYHTFKKKAKPAGYGDTEFFRMSCEH